MNPNSSLKYKSNHPVREERHHERLTVLWGDTKLM